LVALNTWIITEGTETSLLFLGKLRRHALQSKQERFYQAHLIKKLELLFDGAFILKNDSGYLQGVPDLLLLWRDRWAMLEVKANKSSPFQPNQEYYLDLLNRMSFAGCIHPENEDEVLYALQQAFGVEKPTRFAKR
jgi:hypothetical protein